MGHLREMASVHPPDRESHSSTKVAQFEVGEGVFSAREMELQIQSEDQGSALHALQILPRRKPHAH
jgi:hypothetical protein